MDVFDSYLYDLNEAHLDVIDVALTKHGDSVEEYLMYLDDLVFDGIHVPDEEFEQAERVLAVIDEAQEIIWSEIDLWDEEHDWDVNDEYEFDLWDEVEHVESDEEVFV